MKFYFKKMDDVYFSFYEDPKLGRNEHNELLKKLLFSKFDSIRRVKDFSMGFIFVDPAEEAYFLLWGSDGVEV
jgi:hypothetical protein